MSAAIIQHIVMDPDLHAEARRIAPDVADTVRRDISPGALSTNPDYMAWYGALQPLLLYAPPRDLPKEPALQHAWFDIGYKAMGMMPISVIRKAVDLYIRTSDKSFFPAWGKLNELAAKEGNEDLAAAYRIRAAARRDPPKPVPEKSPEEKAKIASMLADFRGRRAPFSPPPAETTHEMASRLRAMLAQSLGTESFR